MLDPWTTQDGEPLYIPTDNLTSTNTIFQYQKKKFEYQTFFILVFYFNEGSVFSVNFKLNRNLFLKSWSASPPETPDGFISNEFFMLKSNITIEGCWEGGGWRGEEEG